MNEHEVVKVGYRLQKLIGVRQCAKRLSTYWLFFYMVMLIEIDQNSRLIMYAIFFIPLVAYILRVEYQYQKLVKQFNALVQ